MRIQNKLFLSLLLSSIIAVTILVMLIQWSVSRGMVDYVNKREIEMLQPLVTDLATRYAENQSWSWLQSKPRLLRKLMLDNRLSRRHHYKDDGEHDDFETSGRLKHAYRTPMKRPDIAVLNQAKNVVVTVNFRAKDRTQLPIEWQGQTIGWLSVPHHKTISQGFELVFLQQQRKAFVLISAIVMILAAAIAFPLARHFVRPIKQITDGANQLTQGHYQVQLPIDRNDELGLLARDFNELATTLEHNENSRKRWIADISHELRTPLSILRGEIEAMLDGVREISTDGVSSMKEEVEHLTQLVDDLYELTKADIGGLSYRKADVDLIELVQSKLHGYQPIMMEHKLSVDFQHQQANLIVWADSTRMNQLLDNILTNAYRYTNAGGQVRLSLQTRAEMAVLMVEDSAPGVPDQDLTRLFDHLYRTEQSRNRESGGSGLGLAICKRIVDGHGGSISAHHSALGGVAIEVHLPLSLVSS